MSAQRPDRVLRWDACYNARDLGGYATGDGGQTRWGAFVRADNLSRLTPSGRAALLGYGVRMVIDLRRSSELRYDPSPFAELVSEATPPVYLHLPLGLGADSTGIATVAAAGAGENASMAELFCRVLDHYSRGIAGVMSAIAAAPEGAVVFHCHAGKDRTGLIAALLLALAGVPEPTIAEDYALSQVCLQPIYDARLRQERDPAARGRLAHMMACAPETMLSILDHLNTRHAGVERYLLAAGVPSAELERLRRRLRA